MNEKNAVKSNRLKLILSLLIANGIRLLKIFPNNDPIMSMALPFSRRSSALTSFVFPFFTIASFDFITNLLGPWTLLTGITYGLLGLAFHYLLKNRERVTMQEYLALGVLGVLVFDFITGVLATPLLFGGTFIESFLGQIPFTLMHLFSTVAYILVVTPILDRGVLLNKRLDDRKVSDFLFRISLRLRSL
jgi:hypothetical protein